MFGLPEKKDETGSEAAAAHGAVQRAVEAIRKAKLDLLVITDVCLCEYTSHGHCGVVEGDEILNDPTLIYWRMRRFRTLARERTLWRLRT